MRPACLSCAWITQSPCCSRVPLSGSSSGSTFSVVFDWRNRKPHFLIFVSSFPSSPQSLCKILDVASLEVLNECNRRSLKKLAGQADSTEQVDDTILT